MGLDDRLGTGRLRQVGVYFGVAEEVQTHTESEAAESPSWQYRVAFTLTLATVLGLLVGLRRSPEVGLGCAAVLIVAFAIAYLISVPASRRPALAQFATTLLIQGPIFGALMSALNADRSLVGSIITGVIFGMAMGAFHAYETRKENGGTIAPRNLR